MTRSDQKGREEERVRFEIQKYRELFQLVSAIRHPPTGNVAF